MKSSQHMKIYLDTLRVMSHPRATPWRIISAISFVKLRFVVIKFMPDFSTD